MKSQKDQTLIEFPLEKIRKKEKRRTFEQKKAAESGQTKLDKKVSQVTIHQQFKDSAKN